MMKKIIWLIIVLFLIISTLLTYTYVQAIKPLENAEKKAVKIALKETELVSVNDFEQYNGLESVWIVKGKNKKGDSLIVWIPEDRNEITVREESDGIKAKDAIKKVEHLSEPKKIIDVRLGMEKGVPLWEIYYLSDSDLINYYHLDFETGDWLKKIENL
jgi:uncharacterized protein YpmB